MVPLARLLARRGCGTGIVARRTGVVTRGASTGREGAPAPPSSVTNRMQLWKAASEFDQKASLQFHALGAESRALQRAFAARMNSYEDAVSHGEWMARVSMWMFGAFGVVTTFGLMAMDMVTAAKYRTAA